MEELHRYMKDYKEEYGAIDYYEITGDKGIDSLLSYKKMLCDTDGITFSVSAAGKCLSDTGLTSIELTSLFGNLIDNAINAVRGLEKDKRLIVLSIRQKADMLSISTFNYRDAAANKANDGRRGMGLPRIRSIVESHKGVISIKEEETTYSVEILFSTVSKEGSDNEA